MPRSRARWRTAGEARTLRRARRLRRSGFAASALRRPAPGSARLAAPRRRHGRDRFFLRRRSALRRHRPAAAHLRCAALGASSAAGALAFGLDLHQHRADRDLVADLAGQLDHLARDRAFHLDRRLVGHHVGELLVLLDLVADLDVPGDDLGLGDAFADVGQLELVDAHASPGPSSSAFFMRIGPGK